jgi:ribosomal protein S18 acetylase RimI-like enzyme
VENRTSAQLPGWNIDIVDVAPSALRECLGDAMAIYVAAMGYPSNSGVQRGVHALKHAEYPAFSCRVALGTNGAMLGFGYGYRSIRGQWWHDLVRRAVDARQVGWLENAFELSELHVSPLAQGQRIGARLLQSLGEHNPHRTMILSTPEGENRAWRLYRRFGFIDLARDHLFPGDSRPFAVLGARLPLHERLDREFAGPLGRGARGAR